MRKKKLSVSFSKRGFALLTGQNRKNFKTENKKKTEFYAQFPELPGRKILFSFFLGL